MSKIKLVLLLTVFSLLLYGCNQLGSGGSQEGKNREYFTGHDGVEMKIGNAPNKVYFYSEPYGGNRFSANDNKFLFGLELENRGSADTVGGIYLSGYDPSFIKIEGVDIQETDSGVDCDWDATIFGSGFWGGLISCISDGFASQLGCTVTDGVYGIDDCNGNIRVDLGEWTDIPFLKNINADVSYNGRTGDFVWDVDYQNEAFVGSYSNNGRAAIAYFTTLYGALYQDFYINKKHGREFALLGDRLTFPGGEQTYMDFNGEILNWPRGRQQVDQMFQFTSCYIYTTYADPMICVDPFPDSEGRKVCTPRTNTFSGGQGAPVAVTRVEQESTPRATLFTIHVENKGNGLIYHPLSMHKCNPYNDETVRSKDLDWVFLMDFGLIGETEQIRCNPANRMIRMQDGRGQITCEMPHTFISKSAYQSPLVVAVAYAYSETIQHKVSFVKGD